MKKWKCTVCGYIHEGETPPEECPLCKAPAEKFEEIIENEAKVEKVEQVVKPSGRRWKCSVCGYIHEGDAPPSECPLCKASSDKFVEIDANEKEIKAEKKPVAAAAVPPEQGPRPGFLVRMSMKFHLHPIMVHMPNGILPAAVVFLAVAIFMGMSVFEVAAFYNMVFVLITMPAVLLTGYLEWKNRYRGAKTFTFIVKIFCSIVTTITLITLVAWRYFEPGVANMDSPYRLIYFGIAVAMLTSTGIAGHLGGKLVFGNR